MSGDPDDDGWREEAGERMAGACGICGERLEAGDVLAHLADAHGVEVELARWPDGEVVVVDETLDPGDFGG